jgi:hypothetical protein
VDYGHHHVEIARRNLVLEKVAADVGDPRIRSGLRLRDHFWQIEQHTLGSRGRVQDRREQVPHSAADVADRLEA